MDDSPTNQLVVSQVADGQLAEKFDL